MNIYWPDSKIVNRTLLKEQITRVLWRIHKKNDIPIDVMVTCTLEAVAMIVYTGQIARCAPDEEKP